MNYRIVDDLDKMKLEDIVRLLRMTYWADKRPIEKIEKSVRNSSCYGLYLEGTEKLVGFARVISDHATAYYLCDVIIDTEYQHKGLGTALISYINSLPDFSGLRGFLVTRNAHSLYRKFGYEVVNERVMLKEPDC
ncbi:MAG: GNAT family N-acetyltransferase [Acidaminococcaceae bacterium]|nr:GNAT family N-acetyltransferase [Acidaminococcaceae bacterium]